MPELRLLDVEFSVLEMSDARIYKVPENWIQKVKSHPSGSRKLFRVKKLAARSVREQETWLEGDVLLTLNDELITWYSELDKMQRRNEVLKALIFRSGAEIVLQVPTILAKDLQTEIFVKFCGAVIQKPHFAIKQQVRNLPSEVYVSDIRPGSLAQHYGLPEHCFITAVDHLPTLDIEKFCHEVKKIPDNICKWKPLKNYSTYQVEALIYSWL
jgi:pro-apoptotic serine protease NMA111